MRPKVRAGDTIMIYPGVFHGRYHVNLLGRDTARIVVRPLSCGRVILHATGLFLQQYQNSCSNLNSGGGVRKKASAGHCMGAVLSIWGTPNINNSPPTQYVSFYNLEITSYTTNRRSYQTTNTSKPTDIDQGDGVEIYGTGIQLNNCVIWNVLGNGVAAQQQAHGLDLYGTAIYYNGWNGPDRTHAMALYTQNNLSLPTLRFVRNNAMFQNFDIGLRVAGSQRNIYLYNLEDNVTFNNGFTALDIPKVLANNTSAWKGAWNIVLGDSASAIGLKRNHMFNGGLPNHLRGTLTFPPNYASNISINDETKPKSDSIYYWQNVNVGHDVLFVGNNFRNSWIRGNQNVHLLTGTIKNIKLNEYKDQLVYTNGVITDPLDIHLWNTTIDSNFYYRTTAANVYYQLDGNCVNCATNTNPFGTKNFADWRTAWNWDLTSWRNPNYPPQDSSVFLIPNLRDRGRYTLVIYNYEMHPYVIVDTSKLPKCIPTNSLVTIRNIAGLHTRVDSFYYTANSPIIFNMSTWPMQVDTANGQGIASNYMVPQSGTAPLFGAFWLEFFPYTVRITQRINPQTGTFEVMYETLDPCTGQPTFSWQATAYMPRVCLKHANGERICGDVYSWLGIPPHWLEEELTYEVQDANCSKLRSTITFTNQ